jgi:glutamine amidotransferase
MGSSLNGRCLHLCRLFAFSSDDEKNINEQLIQFFSGSKYHPHGWGLAVYKDNKNLKIAKEPMEAKESKLCYEITNHSICTKLSLAHIRKATVGNVTLENTHPFVRKLEDKKWIFCHNGTIDYPHWNLDGYKPKGETDSEKIFCTILNNLPKKSKNIERVYNSILNTIGDISSYGKLITIFTDGERLFVYSNLEKHLYFLKGEKDILFSTKPLDNNQSWMPLPKDTLYVYKDGKNVFKSLVKNDKNKLYDNLILRNSIKMLEHNRIKKNNMISSKIFMH